MFLKKIFGDPNKKILADLSKIVNAVNVLESEFSKKTDDDLRQLTLQFKKEIQADKTEEEKKHHLDQILPQTFAAVREAAKRTINQRHFNVQIMGAATLHQGNIAEMKTGEGKTLAATMAVYLNALLGRGTHVVTVNDYLARRDTSWMGQIYNFLGLKVSCLQQLGGAFIFDESARKSQENHDEGAETIHAFKVDMDYLKPIDRRDAYSSDITYGINSEFGFDYLRDNMVQEISNKVQRGHYFAMIDEADSILIDEARTPLIISAPNAKSADLYKRFAALIPMLKAEADYNVDEERHEVALTEEGIQKMERL